MWKLSINTEKTKIMLFSRGKVRIRPAFDFGGSLLDYTDEYSYLGVIFNYNGKFTKARKCMYDKASRAMFALLGKSRRLNLPVDLQLQLFDVLVVPILLYGSEIWSHENCELVEKLHLRYCKYLLKVNGKTYRNMVYGELGRMPLSVLMQLRTVTFWGRLLTGDQTKLSSIMYRLLYSLDATGTYSSPWLVNIKNILNNTGLSYMWLNQNINGDIESLKQELRTRLHDQYRQSWSAEVFASGKCLNYRIFKTELKFEMYLLQLPPPLCHIVTKFRCRNHKLPIEIGCHNNIDRNLRLCNRCDLGEIGDEYHYLFKCRSLSVERKTYLPPYCLSNPSTFKFNSVMNYENKHHQDKLAKFIQIIHKSFRQ